MSVHYHQKVKQSRKPQPQNVVKEFFLMMIELVGSLAENESQTVDLPKGIDMIGILCWCRRNGLDAIGDDANNSIIVKMPPTLDPQKSMLHNFYCDAWDSIMELKKGEYMEFSTPDFVNPELFAGWLRRKRFYFSIKTSGEFRICREPAATK